jgi:hypothetical protein
MTVDKKGVKNAGSKGGKFYINSKGHVVYGEKPHGEHPSYSSDIPFNKQFPSLEDFNEIAKQKGIPEISAEDYKQLYQTEHKAYMKKVKESGTKHLKGLSQEQYDFLGTAIYIKDGAFHADKYEDALTDAKAQGIEFTKEEYMKYYKQVNYKAMKATKNPEPAPKPKVEPEPKPKAEPEPAPVPEKTKGWNDYGDEASLSLEKNVTIIESFQVGKKQKIPQSYTYTKAEEEIKQYDVLKVTFAHGMEKQRLAYMDKLGYEIIYTHEIGTEKQHTDAYIFRKKQEEGVIELPWGDKMSLTEKLPSFQEMKDTYYDKVPNGSSFMSSDYYKFTKKYYEMGGTNGLIAKGEVPEFKLKADENGKVDLGDFPKYKDFLDAYVKAGHTVTLTDYVDLKDKAYGDAIKEYHFNKGLAEAKMADFVMNHPPIWDDQYGKMSFSETEHPDFIHLSDEEQNVYKAKLAEMKDAYVKAIDKNVYTAETDNEELEKQCQKETNDSGIIHKAFIPHIKGESLTYTQKVKFSKPEDLTDNVGSILPNSNPWENIGKMVYWNFAQDSEKWEIGEVVGYDMKTQSYKIKATGKNGVSFIKTRPIDAMRQAGYYKDFYPEPKSKMPTSDPNSKFENKEAPAFSAEEAKEYFKNVSSTTTLNEMKKGTTINQDSTLLENMEVKMRYDESSDSYRLEMKLRNKLLKDEIYDSMKKAGKLKKKVWNGKDEYGFEHSFEVSNYSLYTTEKVGNVKAIVEYNGVKTYNTNKSGSSTSINYDSGWAIRDLVTVSIPRLSVNGAGEAYESAIEALGNHMKTSTKEHLFSKPSDESLEMVKKMNVMNYLSPDWVDTQNAFIGEYDSIDKMDLDSGIKSHLGSNWQDKIKLKETVKGHNSYVIEGYHKELQNDGFKHLFTGFGSSGSNGASIAFSIIKNGGLSSLERHKQGIVNNLSSGHSDYHTGGAEYLFTRMINQSNYASGYSGYQASGIKIRWKPEAMDRTDVFLYTNDTYGSTVPTGEKAKKLIANDVSSVSNGGQYSNRVTAKQQASAYLSSSNEVMFKKGLSPEYIDKVMCHTESELGYMYENFSNSGYLDKKHPDGRLWTDTICLMKTDKPNSSVVKTLTDYIKENHLDIN